jgi:hypothetical protein
MLCDGASVGYGVKPYVGLGKLLSDFRGADELGIVLYCSAAPNAFGSPNLFGPPSARVSVVKNLSPACILSLLFSTRCYSPPNKEGL